MIESPELSEVIESFGEFLKRHREASGKTLDEISRVTRVSKSYLEAFEANDMDKLPETTFARGFLRSYALEIGMDVEDCLNRFEQFKRSLIPTQIRDVKRSKQNSFILGDTAQIAKRSPSFFIGLAIFLMFVCGVVFFYYVNKQRENRRQEVLNQPAIQTSTPPPTETTTPSKVNPDQNKMVTPVPPSVLQIEAKKKLTLVVRLDESASQEIVIEAGESKTFDVYRQIEIRNVNKNLVNFHYNGKPIEVSGNVVKLFNRHIFSE